MHGTQPNGNALGTFVENGDGTVTDTSTSLMWQQQTARPLWMTWEEAISYCESLTLAGYRDWRLPNINELHSIVDYSRDDPAIYTGAFPDTKEWAYWSSTTGASSATNAWHVYFEYGSVSFGGKSRTASVRAVRGG